MNNLKSNAKLKNWILASRPKTLLASVVPVMVGSAAAWNETDFQPLLSVIAFFCSLLIQIGTNFTNDLYDYLKGADSTGRKGPVRVIAAGLITVKEIKIAVLLVFTLAFIAGLYLVYSSGIVILIIGILSIAAGIAYTAGPYPLAYKGLGDIFVFMFFGLIGTAGTYYLHSKSFSSLALLSSIPVGALITNILVINNYRDIEEDKAAGKYTLAVKLGKTYTRYQFLFLTVISFIIPVVLFLFFDFSWFIFLPYLTIPAVYKIIRMLYTVHGKELNETLELTAKLSAVYGLLFSAGLII
jgi:1,4-dihydroxy-2-naphthoate octaprenyltransferase